MSEGGGRLSCLAGRTGDLPWFKSETLDVSPYLYPGRHFFNSALSIDSSGDLANLSFLPPQHDPGSSVPT